MNWTPIIVTPIIALVFGGLLGYYLLDKSLSGRTVSAMGIAEMTVFPDKVIVYLNIQTRNESAEIAKNMNSEVTLKVLSSLENIGVVKEDIETGNYKIYPEYDWSSGNQKLIGYVASNYIKVSSNDFNNIGKIVDVSVDSGALVNYINFDLSITKQNEYKKLVLAEASNDAKAKAQAIAEGLRMELGSLVSSSSPYCNYYPYPFYRAEAESGVSDLKDAVTEISPQKWTFMDQLR